MVGGLVLTTLLNFIALMYNSLSGLNISLVWKPITTSGRVLKPCCLRK